MKNTHQTSDSKLDRKIFLFIGGILLLSIIMISLVYGQSSTKMDSESNEEISSTFTDDETTEETDSTDLTTDSFTDTDFSSDTTEITDPTITIGQENALDKATSYIEFSDFSQHSLRKQLEFEGFTSEEIDYALEYVPVDYEQEASDRALAYYTTQSLSKTGVRDQLEFEGFTSEQIEYAISSLPE